MVYYCKKCGAIVTGKFCSCCGTRATSDLKDFRLAMSRLERELRNEVHTSDFAKYGCSTLGAASLAAEVTFTKSLPQRLLNVNDFHLVKDLCWEQLDLCRLEMRQTYARIMHACYPEYPLP